MPNSGMVLESKRRLSEHSDNLIRSGGPHQQQLATDIATLIRAHTKAIEEINDPTGRIAEYEKALQGQTDNAVEVLNDLDVATKQRDDAQVKVAVLEGQLASLKGLGIASVEGDNLAQIRRLASAGEPLIDLTLDRGTSKDDAAD